MSSTVLVTLGRLPKALELTRGLKRAGCRVLIAEPFGWHVCRLSRSVDASFRVTAPNTDAQQYRTDLARIIDDEHVDVVVPVSEEAIHAMSVQDAVAPHVRFYSPPASTLMALHDKHRFTQVAGGYGLPVPATVAADDPAARELLASGPVVVKPTHGCSGIGVRMLQPGDTLPAEATSGAVAQRYVDGRHVSTFSIAHDGEVRGTTMYEGTVFSGTVAVCFRRVDALPAVDDWVKRFVREAGFSGFISFDFIVDGDGRAWAIECNPRITSGVHFIEPDDLAQAVLSPEQQHPFRLRRQTHFSQFFPALTEIYKHFFKPRRLIAGLRTLFSARDVVWSARDPLPFVLMTPASWAILRQTIFQGRSFGEAATQDIAWFGD